MKVISVTVFSHETVSLVPKLIFHCFLSLWFLGILDLFYKFKLLYKQQKYDRLMTLDYKASWNPDREVILCLPHE